MPQVRSMEQSIFKIDSTNAFNVAALQIFQYQYKFNAVYQEFVKRLNIQPEAITNFRQIPFLPIEFFKSHRVISGIFNEAIIFSSSGTTGSQTSKHVVKDLHLYVKSFQKGFELFFGKPENYVIVALLPSYLDREGSSLVYMVDHLMKDSYQSENGFFLNEFAELVKLLKSAKKKNKRVILFGVTFALLDLAEKYAMDIPDLIIIETGGMKGRRKELVREELHDRLKKAFHVNQICSEYGMTELLSQAYSLGEGVFETPPWMKVLIRDTNDPLTLLSEGKTGGINVIDLANIHSCSFIATQDLGKMHNKEDFEVLGRFDNTDVRGCNLMFV